MNRVLCLAVIVGACLLSFSGAAEVPVVKAKVAEPVLQELMGGCSMKCTFPWQVDVIPANGEKPSLVTVLNDELLSPAWTDQKGVGTKITFSFPKKIPEEMEGKVPFYGLDIINGDWEESAWKSRGRIKKAKLYYNDKPHSIIKYSDTRRWQRIEFEDIMIRSGDVMTFEILEIYPGPKGSPVALSEVVLQGAH